MSNLNLGGFDVVVHLAEGVINRGLELIPSGYTFPVRDRRNVTLMALGVPIPGIGNPTKDVPLLYDAFLEVERPQVVLDQATGRVTVHCDLSPASQLTFLRPVNVADANLLTGVLSQIPLAGSVQLDCPFGVADVSAVWGGQAVSGRAAVARAGGITATLSLVVPSADGSGNVLLASSVVTAAAIEAATAAITAVLQPAVGTNIGDDIGDLPLTNPVRLNVGATPVQTVRDVFARISPSGSPPAISLGVLTGIQAPSPGGTVPAPPADLPADGAVVWVLNYWTLHLVATAMTAAHPAMPFTITRNPPRASFSGAVVFDGGDEPITVRQLDITVNPAGGLAVVGRATASGSCWDADIDFDFNFTFTCDPETGAVVAAASPPNVDVDIDKDLWCQIVGAIVGAIGGFITGAIVGAIVSGGNPWGALIGGGIGAVVGGIGGFLVADALIDPLDLDGVSLDSLSVLGGLSLPLPVGGAGLLVNACDFDDLAVAGRLVYVDLAERHRSGSVRLTTGTGYDLDSGALRPSLGDVEDDVADLLWTGTTLRTLPGSVIGPVFASDSNSFATLSLTDLEGFTYGSDTLSVGALAGGVSKKFVGWVSFALRTDEGRYAKCRARRDLLGKLYLEYVVYARPSACLGSVVTLETLSKTVVESGTDTCTEVRPELVLTADIPLSPVIPPTKIPDLQALVDDLRQEFRRQSHADFPLRLPDLFDRPDLFPPLPPKRPPRRACGSHTTIEHHQADWQIVDRKQQVTIQALPSGVVAPLTYSWSVFGTTLSGSGSSSVGTVVVTYDENSPLLTLVADEGEDVAGSVVIHAMDADGRKLRVTRHLNSPSRKRLGGCCHKRPAKLTLRDAVLHLEEARAARRVVDAGVARLQRIASSGRVKEVESIALADAVKRLGEGSSGGGSSGRRKSGRRES